MLLIQQPNKTQRGITIANKTQQGIINPLTPNMARVEGKPAKEPMPTQLQPQQQQKTPKLIGNSFSFTTLSHSNK